MIHVHPTTTSYSEKEPLYKFTGREIQPKQVGEDSGEVIFKYYPISSVNYVSSHSVYFTTHDYYNGADLKPNSIFFSECSKTFISKHTICYVHQRFLKRVFNFPFFKTFFRFLEHFSAVYCILYYCSQFFMF